jgi:UPF0288 family protein (methanogenesis marker protein 3)
LQVEGVQVAPAAEVKEAIEVAETVSESETLQKTLAIIKPDAMSPSAIEQILEVIKKNRFQIVQRKKTWMTAEMVSEFYKEHEGQSFFPALVAYLSRYIKERLF